MSSVGGSWLEWMGSARGVVVIVAVVLWGHVGVLCYCVPFGSVELGMVFANISKLAFKMRTICLLEYR